MSLEEKFDAAVDVVTSIPYDGTFEPSDEIMLKFYAYHKQATEGPCRDVKPYFWNTSARNKWMAWNELEDMSPEIAMENYVEELTKVIETMAYNEKIGKFISLMGSFFEVVSSEELDCIRNQSKGVQNEKWSDEMQPSMIFENYDSPTLSDLYHISRKETAESYTMPQVSQNHPLPLTKASIENEQVKQELPKGSSKLYSQSSVSSSSSSFSEISNFDLLSDLSDRDTNEIDGTQARHSSKNQAHESVCKYVTEDDIFILTFLNLHNSMQEILNKLGTLNELAEKQSVEKSNLESINKWGLQFTDTAILLIWPVVLGIIFR